MTLVFLSAAVNATEITKRAFDLRADIAARSLKAFAEQSGIEVLIRSDWGREITTRQVRGEMTPREALDRMLIGTGFEVVEDKKSGALAVRRKQVQSQTRKTSAGLSASNEYNALTGNSEHTSRKTNGPPGVADANPKEIPSNTLENQQPMKRNKLIAKLIAALALMPGISAGADEVVTLSEFSVRAEPDRGYVASETMTGTRVATKIVDLPYTVNVLTSEFFEDFAIFELADNLVHIGSFTELDMGGGFVLRGFGSTSQLRDGFFRLGRYGSSNVDRTEIIKGSNAAIYGRTSPGGMINMISKQPKSREYYKLTLNVGDYRTRRGVFEATGPLLQSQHGKTSYILTLSNYEKGFDVEYSRNRNQEYYTALKHVFSDNSSLMLQAEYFHQTRHAPTFAAPLVIDLKGTASNLDDEAIGYAKNLTRHSAYGPNSELNRGNTGFVGTYEKRINSVWSARAAGNYYRARFWQYNNNTAFGAININGAPNAAGIVPAITTSRGATPNKRLINEDGGGLQADLLAHYWLGNRSVENRTLMTIDFNDYYRWDSQWNFGPADDPALTAWNAVRTITLDRDFRPIAPIQYFSEWFKWGGERLTTLRRNRTTVLGGLLRHQSALFESRLLAYAGVRFDAVRFQPRDFTTSVAQFRVFPGFEQYAQGEVVRRTTAQLKPNIGVNYKLIPNLRVFANYSESYFVNQTENAIIFADPRYKAEVANGYDYGFKGSLLEDRLNFTVSGFYAVRQNVLVSETFEEPLGSGNFVTESRRDGDQLVRGYEIDLNWRASEEISITGSWGNVYSIYTDFGSSNPLAVGRRVNRVSPQNGSLSARYTTRGGKWKGFSANLGVTHVASTPTEAPNAGDTYLPGLINGERVLQRTTYQWRLRVPSFTLWNAAVRYTYRGTPRLDQTFALNVNNVFDKDYLKVNRQAGDRRAFYFTYTIGFAGTGR